VFDCGAATAGLFSIVERNRACAAEVPLGLRNAVTKGCVATSEGAGALDSTHDLCRDRH
jgi:hypothetical protein